MWHNRYGKRKKNRGPVRKVIRSILIITICYLLYILIGGIVPFIHQKSVSNEYRENYTAKTYYRDDISVDRAAIVETSTDAMEIRLHMINAAKEKIRFATFSMKPDEACQKICAALYEAAERGVQIEILIDGLSGGWDMKYDPMFYALGSHENVTMKYYNMFYVYAPWTFNGRMHDKFIIIDDKQLILGGRNTSNYFLGAYDQKVLSYDREVYVYNTADTAKNSVVGQTQDYFQSLWEHKTSRVEYDKVPKRKQEQVDEATKSYRTAIKQMHTNEPELYQEMDYEKGTIAVNHIELLANPINIMSKEPQVFYTLTELMLDAKESVLIQTPYVVMNDYMYEAFDEIGKDLKQYEVLLNGRAVGDNICASSDYKYSRKRVLSTGIHVYEFQGDHSTHNKSMVVDNRLSVIGSYNFDMRSTYLDTETMLVIDGEEFAGQLSNNIKSLQEESIHILADGSYDSESTVEPKEMTTKKKIIFTFLPFVLRPIRFLL